MIAQPLFFAVLKMFPGKEFCDFKYILSFFRQIINLLKYIDESLNPLLAVVVRLLIPLRKRLFAISFPDTPYKQLTCY